MGNILVLGILLILLIPYIICGILVGIIIWLIKTKVIKSKILKILIIITILFYTGIILSNFKKETPDNLYIEMKYINDTQSFIGLSSEQVTILLGKPEDEYKNKENKKKYMYYAGKIFKESFWGYSYFNDSYELNIFFDENDKVKSTSLEYMPRS